jgi:hypothetical protein
MVRASEKPLYSHDNLRQRIGDLLAIGVGTPQAQDLRVHSTWSNRGLRCEEVSWSVGYGPRTFGWVMRPDNNVERLPGVLALHGHDGVKWYGKEKIADGTGPIEADEPGRPRPDYLRAPPVRISALMLIANPRRCDNRHEFCKVTNPDRG